MSGKDAQRGFKCQSIIALLECLERNDWDAIKIEPETEQDKADFFLYRNGKIITAIQVKSSVNSFGKPSVERILNDLKNDAKDAENVRLYLVGDNFTDSCRKFIRRTKEIECCSLKNLESICDGKLTDYIKKKGKGKIVKVSEIEDIFVMLFGKIHLNSTASEPLSKRELEKSFLKLVSSNSSRRIRIICTLASIILLSSIFYFLRNNNRSDSNNIHSGYYQNDVIPAITSDLERTSVKYNTGIELYNNSDYTNAKAFFEDAIEEQASLFGIDNKTAATMYYMLGLSCIYSNNSVSAVSDEAVTALTTAETISEGIQDVWGYLRCCYALGTAYSEGKSYNRALEMCSRVLDELTTLMKDNDPDELIQDLYNNPLNYDIYDKLFNNIETLYIISMASKLRADTLNLLGKVLVDIGETNRAYKNFCSAANFYSVWYMTDLAALCMPATEEMSDLDEDVNRYVTTLKKQGELEKVIVQSFDYNSVDGELVNKRMINLYKCDTVATVLTNRAQCGVALGFIDESENDCNSAIDILNSYSFSERKTISYTYNTLILVELVKLGTYTDGKQLIDVEDVPEETINKMKDYADESVTYACELFGEKHWRTARSYEMRAATFMTMGDNESALKDYQRAQEIYTEYEDEVGVEMMREMIDQLQAIMD